MLILLFSGPFHMDDLIYLFYISQKFPEFNATDPENHVIDILTSTWTEFAKTGCVLLLLFFFIMLLSTNQEHYTKVIRLWYSC